MQVVRGYNTGEAMEIEIHTTSGTWVTYVDDQEFANRSQAPLPKT